MDFGRSAMHRYRSIERYAWKRARAWTVMMKQWPLSHTHSHAGARALWWAIILIDWKAGLQSRFSLSHTSPRRRGGMIFPLRYMPLSCIRLCGPRRRRMKEWKTRSPTRENIWEVCCPPACLTSQPKSIMTNSERRVPPGNAGFTSIVSLSQHTGSTW